MKLNIGIDARLISYKRGMGNYVYHLLHHIAKLDANHNFTLFLDSHAAIDAVPHHKNFAVKVIMPPIYPIWEQISFPLALRKERLSLIHCPFNTAPLWGVDVPLLVTIYDIMYLFPESILPASHSLYQRVGRYYRKMLIKRVVEKARAIITVSETSKKDIEQVLSPDIPVEVIYAASTMDFSKLPVSHNLDSLRKKYEITSPYVLGFAAYDPRKNTQSLINAFINLLDKQSIQYQLVLVGMGEKVGMNLFCNKLSDEQKKCIKFTGFVNEDDLKALYLNASMLVFPSLYEGFGLPVLEAMSAEIPVITTRRGALKEIAGDAVLYVEPEDIQAISNAMRLLISDQRIRNELVLKGKKHIEKFSWRRAAEQTLQCYEKYAFKK